MSDNIHGNTVMPGGMAVGQNTVMPGGMAVGQTWHHESSGTVWKLSRLIDEANWEAIQVDCPHGSGYEHRNGQSLTIHTGGYGWTRVFEGT